MTERVTLVELGKLHSINQVEGFVRSLADEFILTRFEPVLALMNPTFYGFDASLSLHEEGSSGQHSDINFTSRVLDYENPQAELRIEWITSSGHTVVIEGAWNHTRSDGNPDSGAGDFVVSIGDDASEIFYPAVRDVFARVTT